MTSEKALDIIDRQQWLDPLADTLQQGVSKAFEAGGEAGRTIKNALHGTWMGHPLHPALTDVPLGAWTAALVLDGMSDVSGRDGFSKAADVAVGVGLAGAVAAALAGVTDWSATDGRARKIGLAHGLLNLAGAALYAGSLVSRKKNRRTGKGLAAVGYALAFGSSYLGGHLVFGEQVGVNHAAGGAPLPTEFVPVLPEGELHEGELTRVDAKGTPVLLVRRGWQVFAIADTCSHAGGPLSEGKLEQGDQVRCPWHGSCFRLKDGTVVDGPATHPQPCFDTRIHRGQIEVRVK